MRYMRTYLGTCRSIQVGRGRKAHQNQGGEGRKAKGGACSQSGERAIACTRRGGEPHKEGLYKGRLEESRQARRPWCHRRWGGAGRCSRLVYTKLQQEWRRT